MATNDDVVIRMKLADLQKFIADVRSGKRSIDDLGDSVEKVDRRARFASGGSSGLGGLTALLGVAARGGALVATALGTAAAAAGVFGVKSAASMQQAEIGFTTMLGSAKAAKALLADLSKFAAATPFEFPQLVASSQKLLAFGFSVGSVIPMLTTIGDAAAGLGLGAEGVDRITLAIGQMQAKTKIQGDELLQLTEAGIPALQILSEGLHKSSSAISKSMQAGKLSADVGIPVLLEGMNRRFAGLMDKQSKSLAGLWSTFKDNAANAARTVATPFVPIFSRGLDALNAHMPAFQKRVNAVTARLFTDIPIIREDFREGNTRGAANRMGAMLGSRPGQGASVVFDRLFTTGKNLASIWSGSVAPAFREVGDALGPFKVLAAPIAHMDRVTGFLAQHTTALRRTLVPLIAILLAYKTAVIAMNVATGVQAIAMGVWANLTRIWTGVTKVATAIQWAWNIAVSSNPIGIVILAIIALVAATVIAYKKSETFRNIVHALGRAFVWVWDKLKEGWNWIKTNWPLLLGPLGRPIAQAVQLIRTHLDKIKSLFKALVNSVIGLWNKLDLTISIPKWVGAIPGVPDGVAGSKLDLFPDVPLLAAGGTATRAGTAIVGERGPELIAMPRGASVVPLSSSAPALEGSLLRDFIVRVYLDGRQIQETTQRHEENRLARL